MNLKELLNATYYEHYKKEQPTLIETIQKLMEAGEKKKNIVAFVKSRTSPIDTRGQMVLGAINYMYDAKAIKEGKKKIKI